MTVLDAYAVIAFLRGEEAADEVAALLAGPTTLAAVHSAEILDQLVRVWGRDPDDVEAAIAMLARSGMAIADTTDEIAVNAGRLRAEHYHKSTCAVSMADCVAAATALLRNQPLATSDPDLAQLMLTENGQLHALPDSNGNRPGPKPKG